MSKAGKPGGGVGCQAISGTASYYLTVVDMCGGCKGGKVALRGHQRVGLSFSKSLQTSMCSFLVLSGPP